MRTYGLEWTDEIKEKAKRLRIAGWSCKGIAVELGSTENTVKQYLSNMGVTPRKDAIRKRAELDKHLMSIDEDAVIYKEDVLPEDNYMISCDYHAPYHSEKWVNRLLFIAEHFKIKKSIIIGDLFDMNFAQHWYSANNITLDEEAEKNRAVVEALYYFDETYLVNGNHEDRPGRLTDGKIQAKHLFREFGGKEWKEKFTYTMYDKVKIGDNWLCVHPRSYSRISPQIARRLCEKYHCNVINSHGHLVGLSYDISGEYLAVDLGGMFQRDKVEYINLKTTTHPVWKNGFSALCNGKLWHFTDATDWEYWASLDSRN